jgi:sporulation protein YlmC with PRC-barrel domain
MKMYVPAVALALLIGGAGPAFTAEETGQFQTSVPSDALTISNYYEQDVYDNQNNKIGDVKDVLLDKEGRVSAVIVGVGGVLGLGAKDIAVPFNALKLAEKDGDRYLVMNTTKEALEKAPGYTYDRTKGVWLPAKQPT